MPCDYANLYYNSLAIFIYKELLNPKDLMTFNKTTDSLIDSSFYILEKFWWQKGVLRMICGARIHLNPLSIS